ncbi:MAG: hypothetical protein D4R84_09525 [Rhodocyclaceae bacterium]|nr:MAG: hypothetical protein D4R84_09525 [Rhodocyclaceae bacterium]
MEYAQARLQARYGAHPVEAEWQQLGVHRDFVTYLAAARAMPFADWLAGIEDSAGPHEIERALRRLWRDDVAEVARWMPAEWSPATRWVETLIDLPALAHRERGGTLPKGVELADGLEPFAGGKPGLAQWQAHWIRLWPENHERDRRELIKLGDSLRRYLANFAECDAAAAWETRRALRLRMTYAFRRSALQPVAAFFFLLLLALDIERLRADLMLRALHRRRLP